jgi:hypothetical protein
VPFAATVPMPLSIVTDVALSAVHDRVTVVPAVTDTGCADKVIVGLAVEGSVEVDEPPLLPLDGTPPQPASAIRITTMTRIDDLQSTRGSTACNSAMVALESATQARVARQLWRTYVSHFVTSQRKGIQWKEEIEVWRRWGSVNPPRRCARDAAQRLRTSLRILCQSVLRAWPFES